MHTPTDYYRGTSREPESISTLRASFGEYEEMGKQHKELSSRIEKLQEAMKISRQRGAFQQLQTQMKEVKELVKQREDLDGKMAVADLARKKDDDHRIAVKQEVSYSEQLGSVGSRIAELESALLEYAEQSQGEYDFARCQRPDGSFYGTRGKCKKGTEAGAKAASPQKETLEQTRERMAGNRKAYLSEKKAALKRGPHHKEVSEAAGALKDQVQEMRNQQKELDRLSKAFSAMEKKVRQEPSKENKERYKLVRSALIEQERHVRRAEREAEKLARKWRRLNKKNQRAMMTPAQLAAERAVDREIRLRG